MVRDNKKRLEVKINHHHVWANYMSRWSHNLRDVYYTTKKQKIRCDSVKNIAMERNFYKIHYLTNDHVALIKEISNLSEDKTLKEVHMSYLSDFLMMQDFIDLYKKGSVQDDEADKMINAWNNNSMENLHSAHEREVQGVIERLANGDLSILELDNNMILFIQFLSQQLSRTKSFKEKIRAANEYGRSLQKARFLEEAWWFLSYMFGMNIGKSLFQTRKEDRHCLLFNDTEIPFITSDQPVINVYPFLDESVNPPEDKEFDLYYPITPKVAYMINSSDRFPEGKVRITDDQLIHEMNIKIAKEAHVHLISDKEEVLKEYQKYIGYRYKVLS